MRQGSLFISVFVAVVSIACLLFVVDLTGKKEVVPEPIPSQVYTYVIGMEGMNDIWVEETSTIVCGSMYVPAVGLRRDVYTYCIQSDGLSLWTAPPNIKRDSTNTNRYLRRVQHQVEMLAMEKGFL